MQLKLLDLKQYNVLSTVLRLAYRTSVSPEIKTLSKKNFPIIIDSLYAFQFIAYPRTPPKVAVTEVAIAKIHVCLVFNNGRYRKIIC